MTEILTRKCACCPLVLPLTLEFFHSAKGSPTGFKSSCKTCTLNRIFEKKQSVLAEAFAFGDTKVELCKCGNYFKNEINTPNAWQGSYVRDRCKTCASSKINNSYKLRSGLKGVLILAEETLMKCALHPSTQQIVEEYFNNKKLIVKNI